MPRANNTLLSAVAACACACSALAGGWAQYTPGAWSNYPTWGEFWGDYGELRWDMLEAINERRAIVGRSPIQIAETLTYTVGWQTNVVGGVTNVSVAKVSVTVTNVTAPFTTNGVVVYPYIRQSWWAACQQAVEEMYDQDLAANPFVSTNQRGANGYGDWFAVTNYAGDPDGFPALTLAQVFSEGGIGWVTNLSYWSAHTNQIKDGDARWTREPGRLRSTWMGETTYKVTNTVWVTNVVLGVTNVVPVRQCGWVYNDGSDIPYALITDGAGFAHTNYRPAIVYVRGGTNALGTLGLSVQGTHAAGSASETLVLSAGTQTLGRMWLDVTNLFMGSFTAPNTGDTLRVQYTNAITIYDRAPYRQEGVVIDELVKAIKAARWARVPAGVEGYATNDTAVSLAGDSWVEAESPDGGPDGAKALLVADYLSASHWHNLGTNAVWQFGLDTIDALYDVQGTCGGLGSARYSVLGFGLPLLRPYIELPATMTNASFNSCRATAETYFRFSDNTGEGNADYWPQAESAVSRTFVRYQTGYDHSVSNFLVQGAINSTIAFPTFDCSNLTNTYSYVGYWIPYAVIDLSGGFEHD